LADIGKAQAVLGYDPVYDIRSGLTKAIVWYRKNL
jgi:nucleoside-diphosphate-sugar epimerase